MKPMITPPLPTHWSPEQALAVFDYLQQIREHIWCYYQSDIRRLLDEAQATPFNPPSDDLFPPSLVEVNGDESDLPF